MNESSDSKTANRSAKFKELLSRVDQRIENNKIMIMQNVNANTGIQDYASTYKNNGLLPSDQAQSVKNEISGFSQKY